jgi:purine-nucleoside/S-methyl-5'-thioadenosine phosphorylase / adenosine deaminase
VAAKSKTIAKNQIVVLSARPLAQIPWLVHGFSTRSGGVSRVYGGNVLNLGFTSHDSREAVLHNRQAFARAVVDSSASKSRDSQSRRTRSDSLAWPLVTVRQIHSDLIHCISDPPGRPLAGDGLITRTTEILLAVLAADCLPIVVVDSRLKAVGVFHAGWRGTLKRIAAKGVGEMRRHFGSRPDDLKAAIGPGIRSCCYQVGAEVREKFDGQFSYASTLFRETKESDEVREKYPLLFLTARAPGHSELPRKIFLDLAEANRRQLVDADVPAKNITDLGRCTACNRDVFFSHRAENGVTGRMMTVVGVRSVR